MIKTDDKKVYFYLIIFLLFFSIEITATIYGIIRYKEMRKEYRKIKNIEK